MYTYHVSWRVPLTGPIKLKFISLAPKKELPINLFVIVGILTIWRPECPHLGLNILYLSNIVDLCCESFSLVD